MGRRIIYLANTRVVCLNKNAFIVQNVSNQIEHNAVNDRLYGNI